MTVIESNTMLQLYKIIWFEQAVGGFIYWHLGICKTDELAILVGCCINKNAAVSV